MNRTQNYQRYMDKVKKERKIKISKFKNREHFMDKFVGVKKEKNKNGEDVNIRLYEKTPGKLIKGKVHCSCSACSKKTNIEGKTHWKASDKKKVDEMKNKFNYFLENTSYNLKNCKRNIL